MHYKTTIEKCNQLAQLINDTFIVQHRIDNPNDTITQRYFDPHIILGYGYVLKDSYTETFVQETDYIEIIENLPSLFPAYFANLNTEMTGIDGEGSAVLIANGKVIQHLPAAEIQIIGGTEQQLLDYIFAEDFDLSELPLWNDLLGTFIEKGVWCRHNGKPYISANPHTVQANWAPDISVSLWVTRYPDGVIGDWRQPLGVHDAYKIGMMVRHVGWIWRCDEADANGNNVWQPGVFGWTQVQELEPGEPEEPEIPLWSSFASHEFQTMPIGTAVMHNGIIYYLINQGHGFREPGSQFGHFGWSTTQP